MVHRLPPPPPKKKKKSVAHFFTLHCNCKSTLLNSVIYSFPGISETRNLISNNLRVFLFLKFLSSNPVWELRNFQIVWFYWTALLNLFLSFKPKPEYCCFGKVLINVRWHSLFFFFLHVIKAYESLVYCCLCQ